MVATMRAEERWFVYLARCSDGSIYTGIARDVAERIAEHDAGVGAKYTRGRGPLALCATRRCQSKGDALRLEHAVKQLHRSQKEKLIVGRRLAAFARRLLAATAIATLVVAGFGCGNRTKTFAPADAGPTPSIPSAAITPSAGEPTAHKAKGLDATDCNPGTSLEPIDRGKTIQSDHFKYTLLDVRTDAIDNAFAPVKKVILVKLQVENVTNDSQLNLSIADIDLTRDKAGADRVKEKDLHYKPDFFYSRPKMCIDLAADVKKGMFPAGAKAIGYYAFSAPDTPAMQSLWFDARYLSPDSVKKGSFLKVAGTLRIK
jgi:putative endonuclease